MRANLQQRFNKRLPKNEITEAVLQFKKIFHSIGIFTAIINLLMLVPSIYMMQVYDRVLASKNDFTLLMLTAICVGMFALMSALEHVRSMVIIGMGNKIDRDLNKRIFTAAFEQNLKNSGINAGQAMADLATIRQFVTGQGIFAFFDAPWFPIFLIVLFIFNFWVGIFALVAVALLIGVTVLNEKVSKKTLSEANEVSIQSNQSMTNNLRNAEVIEAMGMLENLRNHWLGLHGKYIELQSEASKQAAFFMAITKFLRIAIQSTTIGFAAFLVIKAQMTPGMMIASTFLVGRATAPLEMIIGVWKQWSGVLSAYDRLRGLMEQNPVRPESMSLPKPQGELAVEHLTAGPPGSNKPIIRNVSFGLKPGDVMGLVGPSGSGKSSLARLLVGVWLPMSGSVRLDGADIFHWNKAELGPHIGYLPQDIELFAGTISQNIARFGEVDAQKVIKAAQMAGVHEMILRFPEGYDTKIGDAGVGLSGGQRQRIGLARALFGEPSFLILDEPNSNLDEAGEAALSQSIQKLREQGKTVILISHRPSIITITNKLLVLRDGTVAAFGPTDQVLNSITKKQQTAKQLPETSASDSTTPGQDATPPKA